MKQFHPTNLRNRSMHMILTVSLLLPGAACVGMGTASAEKEMSSSPKMRLQQVIQTQNEKSALLDQWILERATAQGITSYRQGIELTSQLNEEGLSHIEDAMRREINNSVFTPLFIRYTGFVKAWKAYDREAHFFQSLAQAYPNSPQVQAAVAVRQSALNRYQRLQNGVQNMQQVLQKDPDNIFVQTLKAALLAQMPGKGPQARQQFESLQKMAQANIAQEQMVAFYQQQAQAFSPQPRPTGGQEGRVSQVAYQPAQLTLQLKEVAPKAWAAVERLNSQEQGNWQKAETLSTLEQELNTQISNPTAFGIVFAQFREIAEAADRTPQALVACQELTKSHPNSPQAQAAREYSLATTEVQAIMTHGLKQLDRARAIDPNNFFIWTARNLHLARFPWKAQEAIQTLEQMKETHQFQIAALDTVLSHTTQPKAKGISAQSASVN